MRKHSSTQLVQWIEMINREEWEETTKNQHLLAGIAYEIRRISCQLGGGKMPKYEEFFDRFRKRSSKPVTKDLYEGIHPGDFDKGKGMTGIEPGKTPLSDEWKAVAQKAKEEWLSFLPPDCIVTTPG